LQSQRELSPEFAVPLSAAELLSCFSVLVTEKEQTTVSVCFFTILFTRHAHLSAVFRERRNSKEPRHQIRDLAAN